MDPEESAWVSAQVGRVLGGRWTLERLLGMGGTAGVFQAVHRNGKRVAIKVLKPGRAGDPRIRRRFLSEGYAANRVGHPAVVSVDDDGEELDGTAFLVMELLSGESLDVLCERRGGRLPWRLAAEVTLGLLDVLSVAHRRGIVHRDIKPANLWWSDEGALRVLDFGLARFADAPPVDHVRTGDEALLGTPAFMAPEQARAAASAVGPLSDLWAVGATMFALLTGRRVYEAATVEEQLALAAVSPAPAVRAVAPDLPGPVADVLQRALEHDAARRWPSADAMRKALSEAMVGIAPGRSDAVTSRDLAFSDTQSQDESRTSPVARNGRSRSPWAMGGAALGVALALGSVAWVVARSHAPPAGDAGAVLPSTPAREPATSSEGLPRFDERTAPPLVASAAREDAARGAAIPAIASGSARRVAPAPGAGPSSRTPAGMIEEPPF
jgi:serine/threonine-protein kinase